MKSNGESRMPSNDSATACELLLDRLEANVRQYSAKTALGFLLPGPNGGKLQKTFTYEQLSRETSRVASFLLESGIQPGDRYVPPFASFRRG